MTSYLNKSGIAYRLKVATSTVSRYRLPPPDATYIGARGIEEGLWLPETIDQWHKNRPGKGNRTPRKSTS